MPFLVNIAQKLQSEAYAHHFKSAKASFGGHSVLIQGYFKNTELPLLYHTESNKWYETSDLLSREDDFDAYFRVNTEGVVILQYYSDFDRFYLMTIRTAKELLEAAKLWPECKEDFANETFQWKKIRCSDLFEAEICFELGEDKYLYVKPEQLMALLGEEGYREAVMTIADLEDHEHPMMDWDPIVKLLEENAGAYVEGPSKADFYLNFGRVDSDDTDPSIVSHASLSLTIKEGLSVNYVGDLIWYSGYGKLIEEYWRHALLDGVDPELDAVLTVPDTKLRQFLESLRFRQIRHQLLRAFEGLVYGQQERLDQQAAHNRALISQLASLFPRQEEQ